jgi:RNA polymerase-binding transcription factor DksA
MNTDAYRTRLLDEGAKLEAELRDVGRKNPSNPNDWEAVPQETGAEADPNDRATEIQGFEDNTAILKDLETRYNEVKDALARIDAGTYSICEVGGETIEEDRLDADPAAKTCKTHL